MADPVFLSNMAIWLGGYDHSAEKNFCGFTVNNAEPNDTTFGDVLEAKYPGLLQPKVDLKGRWSAGANSPDAIYFPRVSSDVTSWPLTMCPPNAPNATPGVDGNLAYTLTGCQFGYETFGQHGQLLGFDLRTLPRSAGLVARGTVVLQKASRSVTTTGTAFQLGALSASQRMLAVLHVFSVTGGTWTLTIESDTVGFGSPVTRATFTGATGITRQVIEIAGPVTDDYWRAVLTKSGGTSCIAASALHILPIA